MLCAVLNLIPVISLGLLFYYNITIRNQKNHIFIRGLRRLQILVRSRTLSCDVASVVAQGYKYGIVEVSSVKPRKPWKVWCLEAEASNMRYLDPQGRVGTPYPESEFEVDWLSLRSEPEACSLQLPEYGGAASILVHYNPSVPTCFGRKLLHGPQGMQKKS